MKKIILVGIVCLLGGILKGWTQTSRKSKTSDNWYIGVNMGAAAKTTHVSTFRNLNPVVGLRLGRHFTPVFGWAMDSQFHWDDKGYWCGKTNTAVAGVNVSLLGTIDFTHWWVGYKGLPYGLNVVGIAGLGWGHTFGQLPEDKARTVKMDRNALTSKVGVDLMLNIGNEKTWQIYFEPALTYHLNDGTQYNINRSVFGLSAGLIYKFKNSDGTHHFAVAKLYDQAEVDALNNEINRLRNSKPETTVGEAKQAVEKPVYAGDVVVVTFAKAKYELSDQAKEVLDQIDSKATVAIKAIASPEGSKRYNRELSENRAQAVREYLEDRHVKVKSARGLGITGETSNRVAIVTIE